MKKIITYMTIILAFLCGCFIYYMLFDKTYTEYIVVEYNDMNIEAYDSIISPAYNYSYIDYTSEEDAKQYILNVYKHQYQNAIDSLHYINIEGSNISYLNKLIYNTKVKAGLITITHPVCIKADDSIIFSLFNKSSFINNFSKYAINKEDAFAYINEYNMCMTWEDIWK